MLNLYGDQLLINLSTIHSAHIKQTRSQSRLFDIPLKGKTREKVGKGYDWRCIVNLIGRQPVML